MYMYNYNYMQLINSRCRSRYTHFDIQCNFINKISNFMFTMIIIISSHMPSPDTSNE